MKLSLPVLVLAGLLAPALAPTTARAEINPENFDSSVKPANDFYHYANGRWLATHPIPPAYSSWGAFYEVDDRNHDALHAILESAAHDAEHAEGIRRQVGDFYLSGMDEAAINAAGLAPLQPEFDRLAALRNGTEVQAEIAHLHQLGVAVVFAFAVEQDPRQSTMVIGNGSQAGLGLPDQGYYLRPDEKSVQLRESYQRHVARMLELSGESAGQARIEAGVVLRLETVLARASKSNVELRDPIANYHRMTPTEMQQLTPHFNWPAYFTALGVKQPGNIDLSQPEFFRAFDALLPVTSIEDWRCYFRWHLVHSIAPYVSAALVNENFDFYGHTLTGTPQLRERWKRVLSTIDGAMGENLGQLYVATYFPPESKRRMLTLVGNLRAVLRARLQTLEWMDAPTRAKALAKLDAFGVKIGYPDKWIDYRQLVVDRHAYVLNVLRARVFNFNRDLAKIGHPKDRSEWDMTPPTVNAYYDPSMNEIVFPAGILQPPFFDPKADDPVNYGAIGAVIGHEMTHGFDDQGRQYDGQGNLSDWWTPESAARFKERSAGIIRQFNAYVAIDDLHVNGELTQGENVADLGGAKIAYAAMQKALRGQKDGRIGGLTAEQRFFLSFATVWRENVRPQAMRLQVNTDPHSPPEFRVNGPLSNLKEFAAAFAIPEGTPMRRAPKDRVDIW